MDLHGQRVAVVGGGVIGTLHAYLALRAGAEVAHLERDLSPHGATVRNFGLIWVSGRRAGGELALAQRSRDLWEEIAREVPGVGFRPNGSLSVVRPGPEADLARAALGLPDAAERGFEWLDWDEARALNPVLIGEYEGALRCTRDAAVESRAALGALRDSMLATGRYRYEAQREVVAVSDGGVRDHRGEHHGADRTYLCVGAPTHGILRELHEGVGLTHVHLHMVETAPHPTVLSTSVANGDSFRYYPAFEGLRHLLGPQEPEAAAWANQLLVQQRLDGRLTIGDTHEVPSESEFWSSDSAYRVIERAAGAVIGELPELERRWTGIYTQIGDRDDPRLYYRAEVARDVWTVTGVGGRGMTCAPAIAEESFSD
jgi:FAD dependent oxidoreductase TIGR03364